jgi:hypothetical protein
MPREDRPLPPREPRLPRRLPVAAEPEPEPAPFPELPVGLLGPLGPLPVWPVAAPPEPPGAAPA